MSSSRASATLPLYARVRDKLQARIAQGKYKVGENLPTEAELCAAFRTSRHTVREALRGLVALGLVERRQGAGSVVVAQSPPSAFIHAVKSLDELWSYTRATKIIVDRADIVALNADEARLVGAGKGSRWLRIRAIRWTADESDIVCWMTLYVHARFARILKDLGHSTDPVYSIIEARSGERVEEAIQEISACAMPREAASKLKQRRGAPALRIVRRYLDARGTPMLVALNIHPAETFTHTLRLRRD